MGMMVKSKSMSKVTNLTQVTDWKRVLNAARQTVGKESVDKYPSNKWRSKILLAEHSPIRLLEFQWTWKDIKSWVVTHFVRHHIGIEKFVHTQRADRNGDAYNRDELPQGALIDATFTANAQALINISRVRLCTCASKETREAWQQVKDEIQKVDDIMASKMVKNCVYRGFCPELKSCGYVNTKAFQQERFNYLKTE